MSSLNVYELVLLSSALLREEASKQSITEKGQLFEEIVDKIETNNISFDSIKVKNKENLAADFDIKSTHGDYSFVEVVEEIDIGSL
jgi:hypothetical protein